MIMRDYNKIGS
jgi:hypothetical protein